MNKFRNPERIRKRNLLIVEGHQDRDELFWLLFKCFPELEIDIEDVWIYGTNLYVLYDDIVDEYGKQWMDTDIDLPFLISKKLWLTEVRYKRDFTNIMLVFDYERHDPFFSCEKIMEMQKYFSDVADSGKLYINYPMIESYQHLKSLPDDEYAERKIPAAMKRGNKYKKIVREETFMKEFVDFPDKVDRSLHKAHKVSDENMRRQCCNSIFCLSDYTHLDVDIQNILQTAITGNEFETAKHHIKALVLRQNYVFEGKTYWRYMRELFCQIIIHNICKANRIQHGCYQVECDEYESVFGSLDFVEILEIQNRLSCDVSNGYIWVLNTCLFLVAEYNFSLLNYNDNERMSGEKNGTDHC